MIVLNFRFSVSCLIARTSLISSCDRQLMGSGPELSRKRSDDVRKSGNPSSLQERHCYSLTKEIYCYYLELMRKIHIVEIFVTFHAFIILVSRR